MKKKKEKSWKELKSYFLVGGARDGKILEPIGLFLFWLLKGTPLTPNMYTLSHIVFSILAGYLLSLPSHVWIIVGALLIQWNRILDAIDGAIARYKNQCSIRGKYIDLVSHGWAAPVYIIGISVHVFQETQNLQLLFLGLTASFFNLIIYITKMSHIRAGKKTHLNPTELSTKSWILQKIKYPFLINYDNITYYLILIGAIINNFTWIIPILAILLSVKWIVQFWLLSYFEEDKNNDFF